MNNVAKIMKVNVALTDRQVQALSVIEEATSRPRARLVRRAVNNYLKKYIIDYPELASKIGIIEEEEKELKPGLQSDTVTIRGAKHLVIITADGWRKPTPDDYLADNEDGGTGTGTGDGSISILQLEEKSHG